ncbi:hypothetical protein IE077_000411 [Cardiosporidium cionae]|uniref:Uncharacterized protein n=1 Tax=Cardiosporidium cionae TaxID=476202 RepID=A0ABQ7J9X4_9APIC|nr:hypothetical protein IE077_000411 [Cardiosporidium cionae]|eukprot:KAF8820806.1 hypothetical protein IE077_000411 [Cardiosporidium cionae]
MSKYYMRPVIPQGRNDTAGRVVINNIPIGVSELRLRDSLSQHGDVRIHLFVPGCEYSSGWAWVSLDSKKTHDNLMASSQIDSDSQVENGSNSQGEMASVSSDNVGGVEKADEFQDCEVD